MFTHISKAKLPLAIVLVVGFTAAGVAQARGRTAERRGPMGGAPFVVPNDPASFVTVDLPSGESVNLRVATTPQLPPISVLSPGSVDPSLPERLATTILTPAGSLIDINIVEFGLLKSSRSLARHSRASVAEWVVNDELPFTAAAEMQAAALGEQVRVSDGGVRSADPVCHVTGAPVVEIYVLFDPATPRNTPTNYVVLLADPTQDTPEVGFGTTPTGDAPVGDGNNDPGGGGPSGNGLDSESDRPPDNEGDGADPIGSPDRVPSGP